MDNNQEEFQDFVVFDTTASDGRTIEMAVIKEFEFEGKNYFICGLVEGDMINEEGVYLYEDASEGDEFKAQKIEDMQEYKKVAEAYLKM